MAAGRRCVGAMARHCRFLFASSNLLEGSSTANHHPYLSILRNPGLNPPPVDPRFDLCFQPANPTILRHFSSRATGASSGEEEEDEIEEVGADTSEEERWGEERDNYEEDEEGEVLAPKRLVQSGKSAEEKATEAAAIGYKVIGPLDPSEQPFKPWEPVFAVVQIGSHQFKVSNGDSIFTERLKFCDVNDKLILTKVLMLGSRTQTIIGRPTLSDATVHAVVEEHALDAKVIIFKKKRRKNYRRTKGHRQELTKLRITDIQGIDKPTKVAVAA